MENNNLKKTYIAVLVISITVSSIFGSLMGFGAGLLANNNSSLGDIIKNAIQGKIVLSQSNVANEKIMVVDQESAVIKAVDKVSPTVVSIIITKDLPKIQQFNSGPFGSDFFRQFFGDNFGDFFGFNTPQPSAPQPNDQGGGTQKTEIGGGSGFILTSDGMIVTNKHVVADGQADYTVLLNDGRKIPAKVLARDQVNDLAVIKIDAKNLPTVELGDSSNLKVGQTVIAIGNALGEFRNTVSTGVVSGLSRSVTAGGADFGSEQLTGVIQTDASINPGNSGGPLLDLAGQVIGINTAIAQGAQNIGFAIPINEVKSSINSVRQSGRIVRAWLGVRYVLVTRDLVKANKLPIDYGALIVRGQNPTDLAIIPGGPANKAGLVENDIILEVNGKRVDENNPLANFIAKQKPGNVITLKVLHEGKQESVKVTLEEMKS